MLIKWFSTKNLFLEERLFLLRLFLFLIELLRNLLRFLTLTIRLLLNLIFGIILKILIIYLIEINYLPILINFYEFFILTIQTYIYFFLLKEYSKE